MQAAAASGYSGIQVGPFPAMALAAERARLTDLAGELGLRDADICLEEMPSEPGASTLRLFLPAALQQRWSPNFDTLGLYDRLAEDLGPLSSDADSSSNTVIRREALVAMMASPVDHPFPNIDELCSALRMRAYISNAAARTALDFHTVKVNRPMSHWNFDADRGFTLRQGCDLIRALRLTTQPDASGELYAFSCYRATEYVLLLGMAEELQNCHPALLRALEAQWQQAAIASGRFHDTFLHELGSNEQPLPMRYYVPGDRVWFRNPDEVSSDASGYEGSWTMYLGRGLFANMWKRDQPFTLESKCVEIYHWRDAVYHDAEGEPRIDEAVVASRVAETHSKPERWAAIVERMMRWRDLKGIYAQGGCIDRTRESPRWVLAGSTDIPLKPIPLPVAEAELPQQAIARVRAVPRTATRLKAPDRGRGRPAAAGQLSLKPHGA